MVFRWLIRKVSKTSVFIFIFLCVSFSLIFFVSGLFNKAIEKQQLSSFRREIDNTTSALALRLDIYQALLYSGKGLIESNNAIMSPEKWHTYVATLQFDKNYPGVHTYSYGFIFSDQQKAAFLSQMHQQVGKNFTISPAGKRQTYAVVSYIEPLTDQTKTGLGVDILPDAARAKDLEKAIQTGSIVVSGKSILFTDAQKEPAFIMRIVFYKPGMSLDT
ncbi:MAG: CHASE domain-containing protein, partial [Candidatus Levyibacteriota bacterium]